MTRAANPKRSVVDRTIGMVSTAAAAPSVVAVPPPMYLTNEKFVPYNAAATINSDRDARTPSLFGSDDDTVVDASIDPVIRRGNASNDGVEL